MTVEQLREAVKALGLEETRPMDLIATGQSQEVARLSRAAGDAASNLMMAEGHLVKGNIAEAHEWLVKARYRLAEAIGR